MIYDSSNHLLQADIDYDKLNSYIARFRQALADNGTEPGRWQIEDDQCFYFISEGVTKPLSETKIEGHKKYIDVQYVLKGAEKIGCCLLSGDSVITTDMPDKDAALYADCEGEAFVVVSADEYLVLFPWDLHRPGCCVKEPAPVKKAVVKIAMDLVTR